MSMPHPTITGYTAGSTMASAAGGVARFADLRIRGQPRDYKLTLDPTTGSSYVMVPNITLDVTVGWAGGGHT